MKKLNKYSLAIIALLFAAVAFTSCNDYLTVAPENDLIKEKFWTKREDVNGALAATYNALRDNSLKSLILGEVRADLVDFGGANFSVIMPGLAKVISAQQTVSLTGEATTNR